MKTYNDKYEEAHALVIVNPKESLSLLHYEKAQMYYNLYEVEEYDEKRKFCVKGYLEYRKGNFDIAVLSYENARSLNNIDFIACLDLGYSYLALYNYECARKAFVQSFKIKKNYNSLIGYLIAQMGMNERPDKTKIEILEKAEPFIYKQMIALMKNNEWNEESAKKMINRIV